MNGIELLTQLAQLSDFNIESFDFTGYSSCQIDTDSIFLTKEDDALRKCLILRLSKNKKMVYSSKQTAALIPNPTDNGLINTSMCAVDGKYIYLTGGAN